MDTSPPDLPTAPVLMTADDTGASAMDHTTSTNVVHLTGKSEPGALVSLFIFTLADDGTTPVAQGAALATAKVAADGTYTLTTGKLPDGTYKFGVLSEDVAGNISKVTEDNPLSLTQITIDTQAPPTPAAPIVSPGTDTGVLRSDGLTNDATPIVTGTAEASATVELFDTNGQMVGKAQADANVAYAITASTLDAGPHTLTVKAVDLAGNVSAASQPLQIDIDTTAPTATITPVGPPLFGSITFSLQFSAPVSGLTARALQVITTGSASGEIASVTGSGTSWTATVEGPTGIGNVALALAQPGQVTDAAGNPATITESDHYALSGATITQPITVADLSPTAYTDYKLALSAGGRLVAFDSADALTPNAGTAGNVYVKDLRSGALTLVSAGLAGAPGNGASGLPSMSDDGQTIAFVSTAHQPGGRRAHGRLGQCLCRPPHAGRERAGHGFGQHHAAFCRQWPSRHHRPAPPRAMCIW